MGTFPLPCPYATSSPIHMVSLITNGSLGSYDPWVVPRPSDIESYEVDMALIPIEICVFHDLVSIWWPSLSSPIGCGSRSRPSSFFAYET